jgi:CRISPR-associated endonuclease Csn1
MAKKYLLGLDLGSNSCGWCVTDENNHIVRKGGKSLWGARLFDEANDCSERRTNRTARRRVARRAHRIDLLQAIFAEEMNKVDPTFFIRMNNSSLLEEDKQKEAQGTDGSLFAGVAGLNDKDFYRNYPTIYHLRKHLLDSDKKEDIRLIYLAIHHIVKYRGNFLHDGETFSAKDDQIVRNSFSDIDAKLTSLGLHPLGLSDTQVNGVLQILVKASGVNDTKRNLVDELKSDDPYIKGVIIPLIAGGVVSTSKLYQSDEDGEEIDPKSVSVRSASFDTDFEKLSSSFADREETAILADAKEISDFVLLNKILGNSKFVSDAMVNRYEKHKKDLKELKALIKSKYPDKYHEVFRTYDEKKANYVRYVGMNDLRNNHKVRYEHCSRDDLYNYLKKDVFGIVKNVVPEGDAQLIRIVAEMANGNYLPRQNSADNGVFPFQLNEEELEAILQKQSKYYPFLSQKDNEGNITSDKIVSLLTFHIPYFVGPLAKPKDDAIRTSHSWVVRTDEKITPWNFKKVVDFDRSAEEFIQRMLNKCTYLPSKYCLPKASIIYSYYELIQFLNNIAINGKPIPANRKYPNDISKLDLINDVFLKQDIVTKHSLLSYIKTRLGKVEEGVLTTRNEKEIEDKISASLKSYRTFTRILGKEFVDTHVFLIEDIIRDLSIFTDRSIVEKRLKTIYGIKDESAIKAIKGLSYSGFGRLSKDFLLLKSPVANKETGEITDQNLLAAMFYTGENLMEIINDSTMSFGKQIEKAQSEAEINRKSLQGNDKLTAVKDYVSELYVSPIMKRPLIQAYEIIDEVQKILKAPIDEYYVECARGGDEKKKGKTTNSRLESLIKLYSTAKSESTKILNELKNKKTLSSSDESLISDINKYKANIDEHYNELNDKLKEHKELSFRSDKLYLYYTQLGICMYSLKPIDLNTVFNDDSAYDIDHIVPQAKVKDDSLENRVLVYQSKNKDKKDVYPFASGFLAPGAFSFYYYLHRIGLIGEKKLAALTRTANHPLTDEELASFTNRQLVSTNQAVVGLIDVIKTFEKHNGKEPIVVYSKAGNVSDFRSKYGILKARDANDCHHAHDAYLNIVVGRTIATYFHYPASKEWLNYLSTHKLTTNTNRLFDDYEDVSSRGHKKPILDSQGNTVWDYTSSIKEIKKNIYQRFDVMVTVRQYIQASLFNKVSIHKKDDWNGKGNLIPTKGGRDPSKYGGFSDLSVGFFALVEVKHAKKMVPTIVPVQNMYAKPNDMDALLAYCKNICNYDVNKVLIPVLRINFIVKKGPQIMCVSGKHSLNDSLVKSLIQMRFDEKELSIIRSLYKLDDILKKSHISIKDNDFEKEIDERFNVLPTSDCIVISPAMNKKIDKPVEISRQDEDELYNSIQHKLSMPFFKNMGGPNNAGSLMSGSDAKEKFSNLSVSKRAMFLNDVISQTSANSAEPSNLSLIGGASVTASRHILNANLSGAEILAQSVTGYYTKVLWKDSGAK